MAVPTHMFKIILAEREKEQALGVFIIPNAPVESKTQLSQFQVSLEELESHLGCTFHYKLNRAMVCGCYLCRDYELHTFHLYRCKICALQMVSSLNNVFMLDDLDLV